MGLRLGDGRIMNKAYVGLLAAVLVVLPAASPADAARQREALLAYQRGDLAAAARLFELELREQEQVNGERHPEALRVMTALAGVYRAGGRSSDALPLSERVLRLRTELQGERHPDTLTAMNALAATLGGLDRTAEQLVLTEKVLQGRVEILGERHPDTLISMNNLAVTYGALGRTAEQVGLSEKVLRLRTEALGERHPATLGAMNNLAWAYRASGRESEALTLYDQVLRWRIDALGERHPDTLGSMNNLAVTYAALGRAAAALDLNERLVRLRVEIQGERHPDTLTAMNNLVVARGTQGQLAEAFELNEKVLRLRAEVLGERHTDTLASISNQAYLHVKLGRPADAAAMSSRYVDGAEWQRAQPGLSVRNRQAVFRIHAERYRAFSRIHGSVGQYEQGFALSELSKARTLIESMAGQRAERSGALPVTEQRSLEELNRRAGAVSQQIAQSRSLETRQTLETQRNALAREYDALQSRLRRQYPKYARLSDVRLLSAPDLPGLIPRDAVGLSYLVEGSSVAVWLVDSAGALRFRDLGQVPNLGEVVEALRRASAHRDGLKSLQANERLRVWRLPAGRGYRLLPAEAEVPAGAQPVNDAAELSRFLSNRLLEPLTDSLAGRRLWIISPDGPLAQLPFEILPWGEKAGPAILATDIHYAQSLSVLALTRARQRDYEALQDRKALFAMGNPAYEPATIHPRARRDLSRALPPGSVEQLRDLDGLWENLPGTEREVRAVAALFGASADTHLGRQATEHHLQALNARGVLKGYRYLLFSTHGYLSQGDPALSSVVLGLIDRAPGTDGYVTAAEWPAYDLASDLAVLSACDTGVGPVVSGEGVMGLPYAMFVAGNVNTVLSLWPVDDDATSMFMQALFARLKAGQTATRALSDTKRQFFNSPARAGQASPSVWGAFILVGAG